MNVEIELKLRVPPEAVRKLQRHPLLKSASRPVKLVSVYFDTPSLELKSKAIALRLRKEGRRWIQTVKGGGSMLAGVHTRCEWEAPVVRNALDFTKIEDRSLIRLFGNSELRRNLGPVFVTEFSRKTIPVEFGGSTIAVCFDRGKILSGGREECISEVELELKSGHPSALFDFALELQKTLPLFVEGRSKAERGYALSMGGSIGAPAKASAVNLDRKTDVGSAFREIFRGCLRQLQGNVQGLLDREADCEYLHQMRIGLRRMRCALGMFSPAFGKAAFSELIPELRWLGGELGPARSWDVFVLETLPPVREALSSQCDFRELELASEALRMKSKERAVEAVASHRFQSLLLKLGAALSRESWPQEPSVPIFDFANRILEKRFRNFERSGKHVGSFDAAGLHALRISGKKLRYAAEFFSALYPGHAARGFLRDMAAIQDALGAINDAATTNRLLDALPERGASRLVRGWVCCDARHRASQIDRKRFKTLTPFWKN